MPSRPPLDCTSPRFVVHADEVEPRRAEGNTVTVRPTHVNASGCELLAQSVLSFEPGRSKPREAPDWAEVLFVLHGTGLLSLAGNTYELEPECGVYVAHGERYEIHVPGSGPLELVSVRIADSAPKSDTVGRRRVVARLSDLVSQPATTDRTFRVLADPASGLRSASHFVGYVPAARSPDHFHRYDEVIYLLEGRGVMHMRGEHHHVRAGSCIRLPARTVHCLENVDEGPMRLVATFCPAGSPAEAYYPDGSSAFPTMSALGTANSEGP